MPVAYDRDDRRRLITVTVTEPYSIADILSVIDRQAADDAWGYAMLHDMREVTDASTLADLQQIADRVRAVGGGRERGPVGFAIRARPALFLAGLMYSKLTREFMTVEVLLTPEQVDAWLARSTWRGPSRST
jgi:hypothetical protein